MLVRLHGHQVLGGGITRQTNLDFAVDASMHPRSWRMRPSVLKDNLRLALGLIDVKHEFGERGHHNVKGHVKSSV